MCTFIHDPEIKLPTEKSVVVYKVFGKSTSPPLTFNEGTLFNFGRNNWNSEIAGRDGNGQSGFQVFVERDEANIWAKGTGNGYELVCPVVIRTKNIVKATNGFKIYDVESRKKVYEVSSFRLLKKDWKKAGGK